VVAQRRAALNSAVGECLRHRIARHPPDRSNRCSQYQTISNIGKRTQDLHKTVKTAARGIAPQGQVTQRNLNLLRDQRGLNLAWCFRTRIRAPVISCVSSTSKNPVRMSWGGRRSTRLHGRSRA
jgi:hypothetical protein